MVSLPLAVFSSVMRLVALTRTSGQILSFQLVLLALDEKLSFSCQVRGASKNVLADFGR